MKPGRRAWSRPSNGVSPLRSAAQPRSAARSPSYLDLDLVSTAKRSTGSRRSSAGGYDFDLGCSPGPPWRSSCSLRHRFHDGRPRACVPEEDMSVRRRDERPGGAYVDLAPEGAEYFLASPHDDEAGMKQTYSFLRAPQHQPSPRQLVPPRNLRGRRCASQGNVRGNDQRRAAGGAVGWAITTGTPGRRIALLIGLGWYSDDGYRKRGYDLPASTRDRGLIGSREASREDPASERRASRAQTGPYDPAVEPLVRDVSRIGA